MSPPGAGPGGRAVARGYAAVTMGAITWLVRPDQTGALARSDASRILDGSARRAARPGRGRGEMAVLSIGGRRAIGKRALHGGLFGSVLRGLFLGHSRIESVVGASLRLRAAGVPTPEVIAAGWRPMAGPFCSLALLTEAIPGAASLHECLLDPATTPARRRALLRAAGETVAAMHAAGFLHADLNLANLVVESGAGGPRIHVVDLDGGRFVRGMTDRAALGNLRRLLRSWVKHVEPRVRGGGRDLAAFLRGYTRDRAARRRLAGALHRQRSRLWLRRIAWGLRG